MIFYTRLSTPVESIFLALKIAYVLKSYHSCKVKPGLPTSFLILTTVCPSSLDPIYFITVKNGSRLLGHLVCYSYLFNPNLLYRLRWRVWGGASWAKTTSPPRIAAGPSTGTSARQCWDYNPVFCNFLHGKLRQS